MKANHLPTLYTCLCPALLHLYDVRNTSIVVIDVLRATSTIATALCNGAKEIIPVDSIAQCITLGKELECITAGERDGQIAPGLQFGNSSFEYPRSFIENKTLVLTTTNGTKLLHMALKMGASDIVTGSFLNFTSVVDYLLANQKNVILACAGWKDKVNMEDTLFAGAVALQLKEHFQVNCDSTQMAITLYGIAGPDLFGFMKSVNASHYHRLMNFGLEADIRHCLQMDVANVLPQYVNGKLVTK